LPVINDNGASQQPKKKRQPDTPPPPPPQQTEQQNEAQLKQGVAGNYIAKEQTQSAINDYLFSRAQAYVAGRAFRFAKDPTKWPELPNNPTPLSFQESDWWIRHPDHWGNAVTLNVPENHHDAIAKFFPSVYEFVGDRSKLADVPGALLGLQLRANAIDDPTARRFALDYIRGVQRMSPGDQQLFLSILMDKLGVTNPGDLFDHWLNDASSSVSWKLTGAQRQRLQFSLDRQLAVEKVQSGANENWWKLSNEQRAAQTQDPMSQNFGLPNVQMDNTLGFKDVLDIFLANAIIAGGVVAVGEGGASALRLGGTIAGFQAAAKGASLATRGTAAGLNKAGNDTMLADVPFFGGALRSAAGENDFTRFTVPGFGDTLTSIIENRPGLPSHMMNTGRVTVNPAEERQHDVSHQGVESRGRVVIKINRPHSKPIRQNGSTDNSVKQILPVKGKAFNSSLHPSTNVKRVWITGNEVSLASGPALEA
jgi:hypothetical protein